MGLIENVSKYKIPSSCDLRKYTMHDIKNFNKNLFDEFCRYIFYLGGERLSKL